MLNIKNLRLVLDQKLQNTKRVIIIPHLYPDFDAIGSAIGLSLIASKYKKESFILLDYPTYTIDAGVKMIIDSSEENGIKYLDKSEYSKVKSPDNVMILTDVNKANRICLDEKLDPKNTIIIDHHSEDENTIKTKNKFIDQSISSASEIVAKLLFLMKVKYDSDIANYLLAGIYLDTNHLTKNISSKTMKIVGKLLDSGASMSTINDFFSEDFVSDRKIHRLLDKTVISSYSIATVIGEDEIYTKEELAKAADYLLKYKTDAGFVIGRIDDNTVSVSARSKGKINVGEVMSHLNGGGNVQSGATVLKDTTPSEINKKLQKILTPKFYR